MADRRTRTVEIELPSGRTMLAEVVAEGGGDVTDRRQRLALSEIRESLADIGEWAITSVVDALPKPKRPSRLEVEFGIKLAVKTGKLVSVLAEAGGESTVLVRMSWDQQLRTLEEPENVRDSLG